MRPDDTLIALAFLFGAVLGGFGAGSFVSAVYRDSAIEVGCAEHDPKTGEWDWIKGGDADE